MRFSDKDLIWISVTPMFPRRVWTAEAKSSGIQQAGALAGDKWPLGLWKDLWQEVKEAHEVHVPSQRVYKFF